MYQETLEAAGYDVRAFQYFGSYQGDWLAVTDKGVIHGYYGSCSYCDAFESEFGWSSIEGVDEAERSRRLAQFGATYFPMNDKELQEFVARKLDSDWDYEGKSMVTWLEAQGVITLS